MRRRVAFRQDDERIAVYIRGAQCINRAVDGDTVAFELLPEAEWHSQGDTRDEPKKQEVCKPAGIVVSLTENVT